MAPPSCCRVLSRSAPARLPSQPESVHQRAFSPSPSPPPSSSRNGGHHHQTQPPLSPLLVVIGALLNPNNFLYHLTILVLFLICTGWSPPPPHPALPSTNPPAPAPAHTTNTTTTTTNDLAIVTLFRQEGFRSARVASITSLRSLDHLVSHEQELFLGVTAATTAAQPSSTLTTIRKDIHGLLHDLEDAQRSADSVERTLRPLQVYLEYLRDKNHGWVEAGELSALMQRMSIIREHGHAGLQSFGRVRERYKTLGEGMLAWREKTRVQCRSFELDLEWMAWERDMASWLGIYGPPWIQASRGGKGGSEDEEGEGEGEAEKKKMDSMEDVTSELVYLRLIERDLGLWIRLWEEWDRVYIPVGMDVFARVVRMIHDCQLLLEIPGDDGTGARGTGGRGAGWSWKKWTNRWEKERKTKKGVWLKDLGILEILSVSLYH